MNVDNLELNIENHDTNITNSNTYSSNMSEISDIEELSDVSSYQDDESIIEIENEISTDDEKSTDYEKLKINNYNDSDIESVSSCFSNISINNEEIEDIDYNIFFKPIFNSTLKTYFIYLKSNNSIEKINESFVSIENNIVEKSLLIKLIKENIKLNGIKYNLNSILIYNNHTQEKQLYNFINNPNQFNFFYILKKIETFELKSTIEFLQQYNGIYFICKEPNNEVKLKNNKTRKIIFLNNKTKTNNKIIAKK